MVERKGYQDYGTTIGSKTGKGKTELLAEEESKERSC